jgi:3-methyladenine DNA glycosylase AlkD
MSAYMRNLFPFLGIPTPLRRRITRDALAGLLPPNEADLTATVEALWALDEREYQYAACDLLSRFQTVCTAAFLPEAALLITTKSWWDTVDGIATNVVGPLVSRHPDLTVKMDRWIAGDNLWLARTALLYQLHYKANTDAARLFRYCEARARDTDFFIRKAIGWALREYSKTEIDAGLL